MEPDLKPLLVSRLPLPPPVAAYGLPPAPRPPAPLLPAEPPAGRAAQALGAEAKSNELCRRPARPARPPPLRARRPSLHRSTRCPR
jgi:hypothetical protein